MGICGARSPAPSARGLAHLADPCRARLRQDPRRSGMGADDRRTQQRGTGRAGLKLAVRGARRHGRGRERCSELQPAGTQPRLRGVAAAGALAQRGAGAAVLRRRTREPARSAIQSRVLDRRRRNSSSIRRFRSSMHCCKGPSMGQQRPRRRNRMSAVVIESWPMRMPIGLGTKTRLPSGSGAVGRSLIQSQA